MQAVGLRHGLLILHAPGPQPVLVPAAVKEALKLALGRKEVVRQLDLVPDAPKPLPVAHQDVGAPVGLLEHDLRPDVLVGVVLVVPPQPERNDPFALGQYLLQVLRLAQPLVEVPQLFEVQPALLREQAHLSSMNKMVWRIKMGDPPAERRLTFLDADDLLVPPQV